MLIIYLITIVAGLVKNVDQDWIPFDTSLFTNYQSLQFQNEKTIDLFWKLTNNNKEIEFGVASRNGAGWVAIGTSDAGGMKGANIFVGRQNAKNEFILQEMFAETYTYPSTKDVQQSKLLSSYQTDEYTAYTFRTVVCEGLNVEKPIWMIFAYGTSNAFRKHLDAHRGQQMVDFTGEYFKDMVLPSTENIKTLDLISPSVEIQPEKTSYCYSFFDLSKILNGKKHHIVKEDIIIGSDFLHHSVGYICTKPPPEFKHGGVFCNYYREKGEPDITNFKLTCADRIYLAWAKGGQSRVYPTNMGKPLGTEDLKYMVIESHYNNPSKVGGTVDPGSGFRMSITDQLRPIDVGMWTLGVSPSDIALPPQQKTTLISECGTKCTSRVGAIPEDGINLLASQLHMHKRGVAGGTRHIRGDTELESFPNMEYFDFDFQMYLYGTKHQPKLLPGDRFITNCTWDNTENDDYVYGGLSSEEEMCFHFIEYYPAIEYFPSCLLVKQKDDIKFKHNLTHCAVQRHESLNTSLVELIPSDTPPFTPLVVDLTCPILSSDVSDNVIVNPFMIGVAAAVVVLIGLWFIRRSYYQKYVPIPDNTEQ
ncbi:PHM/PNGase F domain-containing protein [Globomyces pollinis-pini]|nr:PHM/PNGase F domain-containing protein [Globomyces pollinis-pini]